MAGSLVRILAQDSAIRPSDLPSVDSKSKVPQLDSPAAESNMIETSPQESPSIPKLRVPEKDTEKLKEQDWAAQAMLQKKEAAQKKEKEQALLAEEKARESQLSLDKEKKDKEANKRSSDQPVVSKTSVSGFAETDAQKLPVVTGLDAVKPRAMASGDGRVQPSFNSFTGPSSGGPLGKDFQSGAKPIMAGTGASDGRMQVPPQPPEPPSGAYKKISQDPYSSPASTFEKKPNALPPAKPLVTAPSPPTGDPKKVIENSRAGLSPYDNSKVVPDPRSQRRF